MLHPNKIVKTCAERLTTPPSDFDERILALDVNQSFLIKAPAGSGKTELLTQRYLALLSVVKEPEEILAITFTKKSGNEMRSRIINALLEAAKSQEPTQEHERLTWNLAKNALNNSEVQGWDILNNPNRLRIKTIDAFYGSLARRAPLSALIGGGLKVADDYQVCYVKAARDLLGDLETENDWSESLESVLGHVDNRFDRAEDLFISLLERREQWLPIVLEAKNSGELRENLESSLHSIVNEILTSIENSISNYQGNLIDIASFAAKNISPESSPELLPLLDIEKTSMLPEVSFSSTKAWLALSHLLLTKDGKLRKSPNAAIGFPAPSSTKDKELKSLYSEKKSSFKELIETISIDQNAVNALQQLKSLPPTSYSENEWTVLQHLLQLLPVLAAKLLMVFQREGVVDHTEIAAAALRVLGDVDAPTDLALVLDAQIHHILIDEFQDTNNLQMNGLKMLTEGWQPNDNKSLFLVGDPMQSIYSFRGSNVGLFLEVEERGISNLSINSLELTVNFRSQRNIVDWVNNTFTNVFPNTKSSNLGAIPYSNSVASRTSLDNCEAVNVVGFIGEQKAARTLEGKWLAEQISKIRITNESQSIAVLVRNRSHLAETIKSLQAKSIPYQAIEIAPLKDNLVIKDLCSLTKSISHLGDRTSWLSLLRSPLCGLTLKDLEIVANSKEKSLIWENLKNERILSEVSQDARCRISNLVEVMENTLQLRERKTLEALVRGAWLRLYGPSSAGKHSDLENARTFLDVLKRFSYTSFAIEQFDQAIASLYAKPPISDNNPVQVMTLHKSKGLQFDHVFIPGCDRIGRGDDTRLLAWDRYSTKAGEELPLLSASPEIGGGDNSLYRFISKQGNQRSKYESQRIFYVGCTRAKNHLYLTSSLRADDSNTPLSAKAGSFLSFIWNTVKENIQSIQVDEGQMEQQDFVAPQANTFETLECPAKPIKLPSCDLLSSYRGLTNVDNSDLPDISWVVDYSSQAGQLIHRVLKTICLDGIENWDDKRVISQSSTWKQQLLSLGTPSFLIPSTLNSIQQQVINILKQPNAQWILDHTHTNSRCELSITTTESGKIKKNIIDRTFVDDGHRWVIDYKSGTPTKSESEEEFEKRMTEEYKEQLSRYSALLSDIYDEPIRTGLYLVSTGSFVEIEVTPGSKAA